MVGLPRISEAGLEPGLDICIYVIRVSYALALYKCSIRLQKSHLDRVLGQEAHNLVHLSSPSCERRRMAYTLPFEHVAHCLLKPTSRCTRHSDVCLLMLSYYHDL